jgi:hypothetical protein
MLLHVLFLYVTEIPCCFLINVVTGHKNYGWYSRDRKGFLLSSFTLRFFSVPIFILLSLIFTLSLYAS